MKGTLLSYLAGLGLALLLGLTGSACQQEKGSEPQAQASPSVQLSPAVQATAAVDVNKEQPADEEEEEDEEDDDSTEFEIDGDADRYFGPAPMAVRFVITAINAVEPVTYNWNFGDGSPPARGKDQTHTYEKPGTYSAALMATDATGAYDHITFLFTTISKEEYERRYKRAAEPAKPQQ